MTTLLGSHFVGLNELLVIGIAVGIAILIIIVALFLWFSGALHSAERGIDQRVGAKSVQEALPQLEEIARKYRGDPLGKRAQEFLDQWEKMQDDLARMGPQDRRKTLANLHYAQVSPILNAYQEREGD